MNSKQQVLKCHGLGLLSRRVSGTGSLRTVGERGRAKADDQGAWDGCLPQHCEIQAVPWLLGMTKQSREGWMIDSS